ncbi:MAG: hypothetical protein KatS3mg057_2286 [Herpetosiphonaceae bacterium]|nr:MAG: hypothetical protein KatS3mg057_2286 [Herpetosiphonaceae bacterium]
MKLSKSVIRLSWLIVALSLISSGIGLFWQDGGSPFTFTTLRGETVQLYGQGIYRNETFMNGSGFKGTDAFILLLAIPLLIASTLFYQRGSLRGGLVLMGTLAYFLYNAAHQALSYAYNNLFLIYVALFGASFFAFVLISSSFDRLDLASRFSSRLPRRTIAIFLFTVGTSLFIVWGVMSVLLALLQGKTPAELASSTTLVTHAIDVGILVPTSFLAGILLLRQAPLGYLLASMMVIASWTIGGAVLALSLGQIFAGVLTGLQVAVFVAPFVILTLVGIWLTVFLFRDFSEPAPWRTVYA